MNIYISGISGTGMGPLALMAKKAGMEVCGSDLMKGAVYDELISAGIEVKIGLQDGEYLQEKAKEGIDWFVYTSALPKDHMELKLAHECGIKCTKRDDFTAYLVDELGLKMVAVAGTHGKTTTTAMIIWAALQLKLPVAYIVGTTLGFAPSGDYHDGDKYFIYEADEYDKNFLKYRPWLSVIPAVSYDHPDIYPTKDSYIAAFKKFKSQSNNVLEYDGGEMKNSGEVSATYQPEDFLLAGEARRVDAALAANAVKTMQVDSMDTDDMDDKNDEARLIGLMNKFPGVGRRFEKIVDGVYTDYAHHPEEIVATMDVVKDEMELCGKKGIVVVYQPHQNTRQHEVRDRYCDVFEGADKLYWLPTYLTREDPDLPVLAPGALVEGLRNKDIVEVTDLSDELAKKLRQHVEDGYLVVLMTAGPADKWLRSEFIK